MANENGQEKREMLADIVAEMRHGLDKSWHDIDREWARGLPDRIEAAWKREAAEIEVNAAPLPAVLLTTKAKIVNGGNAAAMRDALETIHDKVNGLDEECGVDPVEIRDIARAALASPARNCDRFADETDAQIAFLNEVWLISVTKETALKRDRFENWTDEMRSRYAKWLFATASERKGDGDGR